MFSKLHILWAAALVATTLAGSGCVGEQRSEFRGQVTWGGPAPMAAATNSTLAQVIGEDFQILNPARTNALTGFGWADGKLVIIHDRQNYLDHGLADKAIQAVYFADRNTGVNDAFLDLEATARDSLPGIHHLQGDFKVERWKSDLDFRIRLKMQSTGPDPVAVDGVLAEYEEWHFRPVQCIGLLLAAMGIGRD